MFFSKSIPKKADIFKQSGKTEFYNISYKSFISIKTFGLLTVAVTILFIDAVLLAPPKQVPQKTQAMAACPFHSDNGNGCNNWWHNQNSNWNNNDWNNNNGGNNDDTNVSITPFPQNNFAVNNTPFQPQFQTISTNTTPDITQEPNLNPTAINQPGGQDIGGISAQIIQVQQQISGTMQGCVNNANNMVNQINGLISQQKNLQQQLDAVNNQQQPNFDTSTPQGQQQQQAWQQQQQNKQQKLQQAIDSLSTTINTDEGNMSTANNNCSQNVGQLEQNRGQLESNLDQAFNSAMNVQVQQ